MNKDKFIKKSVFEELDDLEKIDFVKLNDKKTTLIIDTNFLFVSFETNIDFISEIERLFGKVPNLYIYEPTIKELEEISNKKTKNKKFIPLIIKMLKKYKFRVINSSCRFADDSILENLELNKNVIIATNDKELRKKIWEQKVRVCYMRNKSYFEVF